MWVCVWGGGGARGPRRRAAGRQRSRSTYLAGSGRHRSVQVMGPGKQAARTQRWPHTGSQVDRRGLAAAARAEAPRHAATSWVQQDVGLALVQRMGGGGTSWGRKSSEAARSAAAGEDERASTAGWGRRQGARCRGRRQGESTAGCVGWSRGRGRCCMCGARRSGHQSWVCFNARGGVRGRLKCRAAGRPRLAGLVWAGRSGARAAGLAASLRLWKKPLAAAGAHKG